MIISEHIVNITTAITRNEPLPWSDSTPTQPRTDAGVILAGSGLIGLGAIFAEFSLSSAVGLIVGAVPLIIALAGLFIIFVSGLQAIL